MVNKTKVARMKERERIASVLRAAVLSLCQEKYKNPIEVDALICVALTPTDNHVVKIHETLGNFRQRNTGFISPHDTNGDQNICKVSNIWSMGPKSKRKRKMTSDISYPNKMIPVHEGGWQAEDSVEKLSDISINASGSEGLTSDTSVKKYPYLVQTLCGEDNMYLSTVSKEALRSKEEENPAPPTQPKEPASVASILSGLMIPMSTASTPNVPPVPAVESPNVSDATVGQNIKMDSSEVDRASPVTQNDESSQEYTSIKEQSEDRIHKQKDSNKEQESSVNNDKSNQIISETLPGGIVIKEEPVWSNNEEDSQPKWPTENEEGNNSEAENSQSSSGCNTPTQFYPSQAESNDDPMEMSVTSIKEEPQDSDVGEPEMEIDTDIDTSQYEQRQNSDAGLISETTKNSILLKILKGKSLAEAYKSSVPTEKANSGNRNGTPSSMNQSNMGEDQDNSLVYRLPFVSFQDLFPGDVSGDKSQQRENVSVTSPIETSMRVGTSMTPTEKANRKFDLLTRSLLEKRNRGKGPYSTRLSSGRKNPVNYTEMADVGSDFDVLSDDSESPRSEQDDSYSPRLRGLLDNVEDKTRRPRKKVYNRPLSDLPTFKQKIPNVKFDMQTDTDSRYEKDSPKSTSTCQPTKSSSSSSSNLLLFACSICGSEFSSRAERDRHEEEEQYSEFVKCPLCNGYFGDEMSKRKHMRERHKICEKELFKPTGSGTTGELRTLEVPKFSEGMLTYHTTQCPVCYNFFYSEAERDEHLNKEHNVTPVTQ